ncbi:MAG TPA: hypothetical protein VKN73_03470 [Desulfosalsimonadaceae bacterium]|nr:hypothetical protein [Desulfosalsimonadaceae bacterium]
MRTVARLSIFGLCLLMASLMIASCGEKKQGKVIVSEEEFNIRQDTDHSWVIDAKGTVENVGDVDVKNLVVTGFCKSCGEVLVNGKWFVSDYEKTPEQKDTISYLTVGAEEDFSFRGVAFLMDQSGKQPQKLPEGLEVEVVSFETVEQ